MHAGQKIYNWTLIQKVRGKGNRWRCECVCGTRETIPKKYFYRKNPKEHCGCLRVRKAISSEYQREYRIWLLMHKRCSDPEHQSYQHYGGRGVRVHPSWAGEGGFKAFIEHVGKSPSLEHTLDRIHSNGHYEPGNVRWATPEEQAANKRSPIKPGQKIPRADTPSWLGEATPGVPSQA